MSIVWRWYTVEVTVQLSHVLRSDKSLPDNILVRAALINCELHTRVVEVSSIIERARWKSPRTSVVNRATVVCTQ